jgi:hypothetical protein
MFWKEYNERLSVFYLEMADLHQSSCLHQSAGELSPAQIEQLADALVDDLTKDLATVRTKHEHKGLPKHIFRKIIIS